MPFYCSRLADETDDAYGSYGASKQAATHDDDDDPSSSPDDGCMLHF